LCNGGVNLEELQKFQDLEVTDSRFKQLGMINHLADLIQFNTIDNIDEMVRVWSRHNHQVLSIFYLDNP